MVCAENGWILPLRRAHARGVVAKMTALGESPALIRSPWDGKLDAVLDAAERELLLACPFITRAVTERISRRLGRNSGAARLHVTCLTNIKPGSVLAGSLDLDAVAEMGRGLGDFRLLHLPSLHAKVYVADRECAIVTSGNLTEGGLWGNCEYGVFLRSPAQVGQIRDDFEQYARLGAQVTVEEAAQMAERLLPFREAYRVAQHAATRAAGGLLGEALRRATENILEIRARGRSTHAIFCETIGYLLSKGPLATVEMHPLVQRLHPDICDDRIDRVIGGVNFGKKWKHHVRTAQQALKRAGRIEFYGQRWRLVQRSRAGGPAL